MLKNLLLVGGSVAALLSATNAIAADANAPEQLETVVVFGQGQTRQIQELSQADLRATVPGTSPLKVVSKLPGVNYQAADAFGAYEWAVRISVRGFNQNQLGFTLDDVPLGDMSYGNDNGLHISRAISSENIGRIELAQGTGDLGTASTSNLGGTLKF
ncbi:MAG: TonB-dependent receptor plug domain-containing protein, partial [Rhizomicrobium sp.]